MLTNHLACIYLILRFYEKASSILQMVYGIGVGVATFQGNERTVDSTGYLALKRLILLKPMGYDCFALTGCQHIGTQTNDTTTGNIKLNVHTLTLALHAGHFALTAGYHIYHLAGKLLRNIDGHFLNGLTFHAVNLLVDYLRLTHLQFITFTTHGLNQYTQVQHTTTTDYPSVGIAFRNFYTQGQILLQFTFQALTYVPTGTILAFLSEEG